MAARPTPTCDLIYRPDPIQETRNDLLAVPLVIAQPGPGELIPNFLPYINLSYKMPGNGWFPYLLPEAPFSSVGPGPTSPTNVANTGGTAYRLSGTGLRAWLRTLFGGTL